jgi:hypothetical protein
MAISKKLKDTMLVVSFIVDLFFLAFIIYSVYMFVKTGTFW